MSDAVTVSGEGGAVAGTGAAVDEGAADERVRFIWYTRGDGTSLTSRDFIAFTVLAHGRAPVAVGASPIDAAGAFA
jgi:hypothetical protein